MKVFIAGATGVVGRRLVPLLIAGGHEVTGMTRSAGKVAMLRSLGADAVVADGLDRDAVVAAVTKAAPEVIVHQMTALADVTSFRNFDAEFARTNRLRTEGTDHIIDAAQKAGVRRIVIQSFGNWNYERTGGPVKSEQDPLDPDPPSTMKQTMAAIRYLESAVANAAGIEGVVLRYGNFYGPGTPLSEGGSMLAAVKKRWFPIIGDGGGIWSFIHLDDAASATAAGVERDAPGVYNIADDEPAPVAVWLPELARMIGAKPPLRIPGWLGRLAAGEAVVSMSTRIRGASNAKAKRDLAWRPNYASWRDGFRRGLRENAGGQPSRP